MPQYSVFRVVPSDMSDGPGVPKRHSTTYGSATSAGAAGVCSAGAASGAGSCAGLGSAVLVGAALVVVELVLVTLLDVVDVAVLLVVEGAGSSSAGWLQAASTRGMARAIGSIYFFMGIGTFCV